MKKILTTLAFVTALPASVFLASVFLASVFLASVFLASVLLPSVALADDDDCFVPMADWQPREAVAQLVAEKDWTVRRLKIDDGCYKIYGRDAEGRQIEVTIHPQTLQVIEMEYEDEDDEDDYEKRKDHKGAEQD
jgi:hypothetical protein